MEPFLVSPCGKLQHSWLHSWSDEALCICISRLRTSDECESNTFTMLPVREITDPRQTPRPVTVITRCMRPLGGHAQGQC